MVEKENVELEVEEVVFEIGIEELEQMSSPGALMGD